MSPPLVFDGMDDAVLGLGEVHGEEPRVVYGYDKLVEVIEKGYVGWPDTSEQDHLDAVEYVDYNIVGLSAGKGTPIILFEMTIDDIHEQFADDLPTDDPSLAGTETATESEPDP